MTYPLCVSFTLVVSLVVSEYVSITARFDVFFFFKQKTAYGMRISDWSSDVCSSDLRKGGPGTLAFCWAHVRRGFFDDAKGGNAPVAEEALRRIASLYRIEARIRGSSPEHRLAVRQAESASIIADMLPWFEEMLPKLPRGSNTAEAIRYTLNPWKGLIRFLDDGRLELDNNPV